MQIALLDDDDILAIHVTELLARSGHQVRHYRTARSMMRSLRQDSFDLLMLDWNLPDGSGLEVLAWVREKLDPPPPTIMITARTGEADIVAGLTGGADDYIVKPMHDDVLKARVEALLRRAYGGRRKQNVEIYGEHAFDVVERTASVAGTPVVTTAKEFSLALLLFRNLHRPLSRSYVVETVWGHALDPSSRTLDAHISQIRNRLGLRPENGVRLSSVYGFGYRLEALADPAEACGIA